MKRVIEELVDDLDGSKADGTTVFAFDGKEYEIDLSRANRTKMAKEFKQYIEHGRLIKRKRGAGSQQRRPDLAQIREWAAENGHRVSAHGRVPEAVVEAYDAVH